MLLDHCRTCSKVLPRRAAKTICFSLVNQVASQVPTVSDSTISQWNECSDALLLQFANDGYDYGDALKYGDCWINADTVFVVTTASVDAVRVWFTPLECTEILEETDLTKFKNLPLVPSGSHFDCGCTHCVVPTTREMRNHLVLLRRTDGSLRSCHSINVPFQVTETPFYRRRNSCKYCVTPDVKSVSA